MSCSLADGTADPVVASRAKLQIGRSARQIGQESIQLHGGIGITWEHDIQLFFKRAQATSQMFGAPHTAVTEAARALR